MEIIVVITIIIALMTVSIIVGGSAKKKMTGKATKTTLRMLSGLMTDYLAAGNPEPAPPTPWPYPADAVPSYKPTNPPTDPINWLKALRAVDSAGKMNGLTIEKDDLGNSVLKDGFGSPIRFRPTPGGEGGGYFISAGPDGRFNEESPPPGGPKAINDDIKSTDGD